MTSKLNIVQTHTHTHAHTGHTKRQYLCVCVCVRGCGSMCLDGATIGTLALDQIPRAHTRLRDGQYKDGALQHSTRAVCPLCAFPSGNILICPHHYKINVCVVDRPQARADCKFTSSSLRLCVEWTLEPRRIIYVDQISIIWILLAGRVCVCVCISPRLLSALVKQTHTALYT